MAQPLIKFYRASVAPTEGLAQGAIWFNPDNNEIRVYNGTTWEQYSGLVKNVEYAEATKILTITPFEGEATTINLENFVKGYIEALDYADTAVVGEYVSKVSQTDGLIAVTHEKLPVVDVTAPDGTTIVNSESKKAELSQVTATTINAAEGDCSDNKFATEAAVRKAINALDYTDTAVEGQYVSAVSETDGIITVTRANLPVESADVDSLDGKTGVITTLKGQTTIGAINLEVDANNQLTATLVGSFENGAQVNKLEAVSVDGNALSIVNKGVNWGLNYDSTAKQIQVLDLNKGNAVLDYIDATDFIKDGVVHSGKLVWCLIEDDVHTEVSEGTKDAVHCLKLTINTDEVDVEGNPIYDYVHIPLGELCDVYTGEPGEITVSSDNIIGLADKPVAETTGEGITLENGGSFDVVTDVTYDEKGRIATVETSTVTLPTITIGNGEKEGADEYVTVGVKTTAGIVSEVTVNTDALSTKISGIEDEISENAQVTAAALNDLNERIDAVSDSIPTELGVMSVTKGTDGEFVTTTIGGTAADPTIGVAVDTAEDIATTELPSGYVSPTSASGLATDKYVQDYVASQMQWTSF